MISERIKLLREHEGMTQSMLARKLGITRSSVNAWEMGISAPSTKCLVELAEIFNVSTDYILGRDSDSTISVEGLDAEDIRIVYELIKHLNSK